MNKIALIFLIQIIWGYSCKAQNRVSTGATDCVQEYDSTLQQKVYTNVDKMPEFEEGELSLMKFFRDHFRYPKDQDFFQGSINLVFVIGADGQVKNVHIANKQDASLTLVDKEALRVLNSMPKWKPGRCKGENVPVRMFWPIRF
ncbi:TonB protein C-terminal [Chitinophaga eiseniae]|uniref:TonB protein C-terminal n=1 Tax=Chitinophaga eiseniae TaxID=634771 RepID=A0A1T4TLG5_9BACT|nr:energy transducer TonB [Chitinophaga eiseniae]SKA41217.1 TonB protein C-terminal [Chitinophaga eiseniae]